MFRPELDDDIEGMVNEIIDESVTVPLSSDNLSFNQKMRILVEAVYAEMQKAEDPRLVIDNYYLEKDDDEKLPNPDS